MISIYDYYLNKLFIISLTPIAMYVDNIQAYNSMLNSSCDHAYIFIFGLVPFRSGKYSYPRGYLYLAERNGTKKK